MLHEGIRATGKNQALQPQYEHRLKIEEPDLRTEGDEQKQGHRRNLQETQAGAARLEKARLLLALPSFGRQGLGQKKYRKQYGEERNAGRDEERDARTEIGRRHASKGRAEHKPQPKGGVDQPQPARAILLVGDVAEVGLGHRNVAARQTVNRPRDK